VLTEAAIKAVAEFTRVAGMLYPRLCWEELTTEAGKPYLLVYENTAGALNAVSWFIEPVPAVGVVGACWAVITTHRADHVLFTGGTPEEALQGATKKLAGYLKLAADGAASVALQTCVPERRIEMEDVL
jgi:hypothetical protein